MTTTKAAKRPATKTKKTGHPRWEGIRARHARWIDREQSNDAQPEGYVVAIDHLVPTLTGPGDFRMAAVEVAAAMLKGSLSTDLRPAEPLVARMLEIVADLTENNITLTNEERFARRSMVPTIVWVPATKKDVT